MQQRIKLCVFWSMWCLAAGQGLAQGTQLLYLNPVEDAVTTLQFPNTNWGQHNQLSVYAWT